MIQRLWCLWGGHDPAPVGYLPGFRCRKCDLAGADLGAFDRGTSGYVGAYRRTYDRDRREVTRESGGREWDAA